MCLGHHENLSGCEIFRVNDLEILVFKVFFWAEYKGEKWHDICKRLFEAFL